MDSLIGSILKNASSLIRMLRVLRVSRLFKLMKTKQLEGINKIIKTLVFSLPSLMNVLVLLFLVYFIFAVLAVFLFKGVPVENPDFKNEIYNFENFHNALLTLFRCSTGEDWPTFMYVYGEFGGSSTSNLQAKGFFLIYIFFSATVMLKVFQLVVMQQFDEFYFNPDNPINSFDDISGTFRRTWNQFTIKTRGTKIKASRIVDFFYYLEEPLGYRIKEESEDEDIGELISSRKKFKTTNSRYEIAYNTNMLNLYW